MNYKVRLADPVEWARLLESTESDYSLSQTYEFGDALTRAYDEYSYEPRIFEFSDGLTLLFPLIRIRRRPGFLRCFEAMPFSLNGNPLAIGEALTAEHLTAAVRSLRAHSIRINLGSSDQLPLKSANDRKEPYGLEGAGYFVQMLSLEDGFNQVWTNCFSSKVRQQCRMSERKGVEIYSSTGLGDFEDFYSIYANATKGWGYQTPPYPLALFRAMATLAGNGIELKLARVEGRNVAGVLLLHGRRATFGWIGAMRKEFARYHPTVALFRSVISDACGRGMDWYDFGAYGKLDSVREHKERYGAREFCRQVFISTTQSYRLVEQLKKVVAQTGS